MTTAKVWDGDSWEAFTGAKVWDGDSWETIEPFGEAPPPGDPPELIVRYTFPGGDLTGWAVGTGGEWSENPDDWIYAAGNGVGYTFIRRTMPVGTVYVEVDTFMDLADSDWVAVRLNDNNAALYDNGAYGAIMRGNGQLHTAVWAGGSDAGIGAGDLADGPHTEGDAVALGLYVVSSSTTELYVDRVLRRTATGQSDQTSHTYLTVGCYNFIYGHFKEVRCYSDFPSF